MYNEPVKEGWWSVSENIIELIFAASCLGCSQIADHAVENLEQKFKSRAIQVPMFIKIYERIGMLGRGSTRQFAFNSGLQKLKNLVCVNAERSIDKRDIRSEDWLRSSSDGSKLTGTLRKDAILDLFEARKLRMPWAYDGDD